VKLTVPNLSLVVLIGPSGSGKSHFARRHFKPTEALSSDACRGLVADDETDQSATPAAFAVLHFIASQRLAAGRLTVVDATNVQPEARKPLIELARKYHVIPVAIVLNVNEEVCRQRNRERPDRDFGPHVVRQQCQQLRRSLRGLRGEGFRYVYVLGGVEEVEAAVIERQPLWTDRRHESGPFDVVGDVHGCCDELEELLALLGYRPADGTWPHPQGRKAVFVGDLVDPGPCVLDAVYLVNRMAEVGQALCVPGNHDLELVRALRGKAVRIKHGLDRSLAESETLTAETRSAARAFSTATRPWPH
jgi:protein phosphatase